MQTLFANVLQDSRYAIRQLRRSPIFSLTVIATLALAIGATAALTAVLRSTLFSTLPYAQPKQLVQVQDTNLRGFRTNGLVGAQRIADLTVLKKGAQPVFSSVAAYYGNVGQLAPDGHEPVSTQGAAVSGNFFSMLGVPAALGHTINPADDITGTGLVLVLSDRLWRGTFAADPHVLGRSVRLGTEQATVIGVMPPGFELPTATDLWYPAHFAAFQFGSYRGDGTRFIEVIARLAPSTTLASARQGATLLAHRLAVAYPNTDAAWAFRLIPLRSSLFGTLQEGLFLLSAAIVLVLIVVIVNIAGLQMARNVKRSPEFAIRAALGITRRRQLAQLATESTLLIGTGSLCGVVLAYISLHLLKAILPESFSLVTPPHLDGMTIGVACLLALIVSFLVAGLATPRISQLALDSRTVARGRRRFGRLFSAAQIALTLVLLTLSAAVLGSLYRLLKVPLGFNPSHVLTCSVNLGWNVDVPARHRLYAQLEREVAALPGVEAVGSTASLPLTDLSIRATYDVVGRAPTPQHDTVVAESRSISPGYLGTMRIPLLAGRSFTEQDADPNHPPVVAVNQTLAALYFPGQNAVGQRLLSAGYLPGVPLRSSEIIAVIADVRGTGGELADPPQPAVFNPEDGNWPHMHFSIRSSQPASTLTPEVRRLVTGLNASASASDFIELSSTIDRALQQPRWNAALLTALAALSLVLVVLGIYGLVAFEVAERTRELALRLALGASRAGILRLLFRETARLLGLGIGAGLLASLATSRLLHTIGIDFAGPGTGFLLAPTVLVLVAAVLFATVLPARRAAAIDPTEALRTE